MNGEDIDKLLSDYVTPATPKHAAPLRHVTITGRVSDQQNDMSPHMYSDSVSDTVTHPRDLSKSWQAGSRRTFSHVRDMQRWLDSNVGAYTKTHQHWQEEVMPRRILYAYGTRGNGRLTCLADFCCRNRINLLFVRHSTHPKDMFFNVYEQAKKMQPCIVYINNATRVFSDAGHTKEFVAAYSSVLTSSAMNIWTVLSGSYPPKMLLLHSKHSAHPIYTLIEHSGDIVHVPCISDIDEAARVAVEFLRELTADREYATGDAAWSTLINHMARAFLFHTMYEIRIFLRDIIAKHNMQCALTRSTIRSPPMSIFDAALQRLPLVDSCNQQYRKLYSRDVYADHNDQLTSWRSYVDLTAPVQYEYTPSVEQFYEPASISSPSREYDPAEVIPRSAPERPAKRQREHSRTYTSELSRKPLPSPKRSAVSFFRSNY